MRKAHLLLAAALLVSPAAFGQVGVKNMVQKQLQDAMQQHNQQLEDAMNPKQPQQQPAPTPGIAIKDGWITRKSKDGKTDVRLYFAYPEKLDKSAPAAGLVVLQEWWGLNDDIQERTREFAQHGFYAVAPDLYNGQSTDDPKKAAELHKKMSDASAMTDMKTALDLLEEESYNKVVDAKRIGSIGWCMGGHQSLLLSIADPRVKATVIFYGGLISDPAELQKIQGPVLAIFGDDDKSPGITPADVDKFRAGLKAAGKTDALILSFTGAGHAFASKAATKMGMYKPAQAKEAWAKTWEWLGEKLAKRNP